MFCSFGANATYNEKLKKKIEPVICGTGYSAFLLVGGNIKRPINSNYSHFTPLKTIKKNNRFYTLIKATCGGNIGSNVFCIDHAINNLFYATNIVFPNFSVDIIMARSCSRPLNKKNSGINTEVFPGLFMGTGFGGKGITDAPAFAALEVNKKLISKNITAKDIEDFIKNTLKI